MLIRKQKTSNKKLKIRMLLCAFFIILLLIIPVTRRAIKYVAITLTTPIVYISHSMDNNVYSFFQTLRFKSSLVAENVQLSQQIQNLNAQYADYGELQKENQDLKSVMDRSSGMDFILSIIISKPPTSLYDTLLIDGGDAVGMQIGQSVYANGDVPIGTIAQVFPKSAPVELYSSPSEKIDARIDPLHIDVTLFGHGGGDLLVSVPHDLVVPENAIVVSKEINPHVLGKLEKIISDPRDSSQTLIFSSPVNINDLDFVEVAK